MIYLVNRFRQIESLSLSLNICYVGCSSAYFRSRARKLRQNLANLSSVPLDPLLKMLDRIRSTHGGNPPKLIQTFSVTSFDQIQNYTRFSLELISLTVGEGKGGKITKQIADMSLEENNEHLELSCSVFSRLGLGSQFRRAKVKLIFRVV